MNEQLQEYDMDGSEGQHLQPSDDYGGTSPFAPRLWRAHPGINYVVSSLVTLIIALIFAITSEECQHWCIIPLGLCGVIAGVDIIAWARREIDLLDPKFVIAVFLYFNCFVSPLLHMKYYIYGRDFYTSDWAAYFGYLALYNALGIVLFKLAQNMFFKMSRPTKKVWKIVPDKFAFMLMPIFCISLTANMVIRFVFGGLQKEEGFQILSSTAQANAAHISWISMLSYPFPTLIMMAVVYWIYTKRPNQQRSVTMVISILVFITLFQFFWVGMRGGRGAFLNVIFIAVAMIHYRLRLFSVKFFILGMCLVFLYSYFYNFYKKLGARGLEAIYSTEARESIIYEQHGGFTLLTTTLGDFSRADVQARMLYHLDTYKDQYKFRYGGTYLNALLRVVPRGIWKNKPVQYKRKAGTEIVRQALSGEKLTSRVYGLSGEAILNFGPLGIVPAFIVFGCILGWFRKKISTMTPSDSRFFLVPLLLLVFNFAIINDLDNLTFALLRGGVLPFIIVFFSSTRSMFVSDDVDMPG